MCLRSCSTPFECDISVSHVPFSPSSALMAFLLIEDYFTVFQLLKLNFVTFSFTGLTAMMIFKWSVAVKY